MGLKRKKSDGKMQILWNQATIDKIWARFIPSKGYLPNLPNLPNSSGTWVSDREIKNRNLPDLPENANLPDAPQNGPMPYIPENREDREIAKNNLPDEKPYQVKDREIREEREITPGEVKKRAFFEEGTI